MNLSNLIQSQALKTEVIAPDRSGPEQTTPLIVVTVNYFSGGTINVTCNASGEKVGEAMKAILQGAIDAIDRGIKVQST